VRARGSDTPAAREVTRPWASVGAALRYAIPIFGPIRVEAAIEALAAIERDRFFLGTDEVFVVPPVHGRLLVGVGF
jgi:hypothetical protein